MTRTIRVRLPQEDASTWQPTHQQEMPDYEELLSVHQVRIIKISNAV